MSARMLFIISLSLMSLLKTQNLSSLTRYTQDNKLDVDVVDK